MKLSWPGRHPVVTGALPGSGSRGGRWSPVCGTALWRRRCRLPPAGTARPRRARRRLASPAAGWAPASSPQPPPANLAAGGNIPARPPVADDV